MKDVDLHPEHAASRIWAIQPSALMTIGARDYARLVSEQASVLAMPSDVQPAATSAGAVAVINIQGVITPRGSWLLRALGIGGGGLDGLREALAAALADDEVGSILLNIDSPGGLVDLVPETAKEIREARGTKKIVALSNTCAASAAYYLAAQADEVVVTPSGEVGSIGVLVRHEDISALLTKEGIKVNLIYAGKYKVEGNPFEPLTKSAEAAIQSKIDDFYDMFVGDVAAGRGISPQDVIVNYGEGRTVLADRALAAGMVDRVETFEEVVARLGGSLEDEGGTEDDEGEEDETEAAVVEPTTVAVTDEPPAVDDENSAAAKRRIASLLLG